VVSLTKPLGGNEFVTNKAHNKAHRAVTRRIAVRYGGTVAEPNSHVSNSHVLLADGLVQVETSATLAAGIERLKQFSGRRFVAVTNKETLPDALALVDGTDIGVMDSQGEIVRPAG
jgi:hypothetical protein